MTNIPDRREDASRATAEQPLRLLIVDDDPNYRAYIAALTRRLGFWADAAPDGQSALQRLSQGWYDVAVIDLQMPGLSGLETIARIRADAALATLYAIMLTGHEDLDTKLTSLDAGFDDFLTKGCSERELVAKLVAARRLATRQRTMSVAVRDLYGLATRDDLTGAFNRRFFISETERLLAEGIAVNLVLLDINDFKLVNDRHGHLAGDNVLRDVATSLHSTTRSNDIVARFGGDEFVVAIPHLDVSAVERIAGRLTEAVAALEWKTDPPLRVTISAGLASSRLLEKPTLVQLVNAADRDMYKNKWLTKHPDLRPELYEYPAQERNIVERFAAGENRVTATALPKVLVVEDDAGIRGLLVAALGRERVDVAAAPDGREALRLCDLDDYAVILLDLMMPEVDGFQFLETFGKTHRSARSIVFVTTAYDDRVINLLPADQVHAVVSKPFDVQNLSTIIASAAQAWVAQTRAHGQPESTPQSDHPAAETPR